MNTHTEQHTTDHTPKGPAMEHAPPTGAHSRRDRRGPARGQAHANQTAASIRATHPFTALTSTTTGGRQMATHDGHEPASLDGLPPLLPIPRAAAFLGISRASAYRYAAAGDLPVRRLGGRVYVITARLRALIEGTDEDAA